MRKEKEAKRDGRYARKHYVTVTPQNNVSELSVLENIKTWTIDLLGYDVICFG